METWKHASGDWTDGFIRIPRWSDPRRVEWERVFVALCEREFLKPGQRFEPVAVPTAEAAVVPKNGIVNYDRYFLYKAMLEAGEPVPPIVVERYGDLFYIPDGNHRTYAARAAGVKTLRGLAIRASG